MKGNCIFLYPMTFIIWLLVYKKLKNKLIGILIAIILLYIILNYKSENFLVNKKPLLFIHIPKTGGTYVENLLKESGYDVGINDKFLQSYNKCKLAKVKGKKSKCKCSFWHTPPKYNNKINFNNFITFTIVRNPIDRFVSEFNYNKYGDLERFSKKLNSKSNINDFAKFIRKNKNVYKGNCHLLNQSEYLTDYYGNKVENILHQENLNEELLNFSNKYNLNINFDKNVERNFKDKNSSVLDLSNDSIEIIKDYYKNDFINCDYK